MANEGIIFVLAEREMHRGFYLPAHFTPQGGSPHATKVSALCFSGTGRIDFVWSLGKHIAGLDRSSVRTTVAAKHEVHCRDLSSIGNGGHSFALNVSDGGNKQTMQFVVDKDTQVQGQVKVGATVTVVYVAMADQNLTRNITIQG